MENWAQKVKKLPESVKTVYIYFNNDAEAYAVRNALNLIDKLKS